MQNKKIPLVLICDDNFVVPAGVTVSSIISSKEIDTCYDIYIICASLSPESEVIFSHFNSDTVTIHIIQEDANRFVDLHSNYSYTSCAAPPVALLKFILPDIFKEYDKILYLDVDILVLIDLSELYSTELGDNLLAAVMTSTAVYDSFYQVVPDYFNSGVMLLNLAQMRMENTSEALIRTKTECEVTMLMDQQTYNYVCTGRVKLLPIRYNLLAVILDNAWDKWSVEGINQLFGTHYSSKEEVLRDGAIIHFASKDKPWKNPGVIYADKWLDVYCSTPILHIVRNFYLDMLIAFRKNAGQFNNKLRENIKKYITARIDIKLFGDAANLELLDISDVNATITIPDWFQEGGKGYQIETCAEKLNLSFRMDTSGKLNIYLRGMDIRDNSGKSLPYWVNYKMLSYNGITEFTKATYAWHDKPITISHEVKVGETVYLNIEWEPCKMENPELPKLLKDTEKKLHASLSREASLKKSVSFRAGRAITWVPRKVRGGVRCLEEHGPVYTVKRFFWHITH